MASPARFFKDVTVELVAWGYAVALDGKLMRTPASGAFVVPALALAEAIAEEWRGQTGKPNPKLMPITQLAATAIDRARPRAQEVAGEIAALGATDLLLSRAGEPADLAARQMALWQPWLDWLQTRFGVTLIPSEGIICAPQSQPALERLAAVVAARDEFQLTGLADLSRAMGSVVLALAVADGALAPDTAADFSQLEEHYQAGRWGVDAEALARRQALSREIAAAARFLELCRG